MMLFHVVFLCSLCISCVHGTSGLDKCITSPKYVTPNDTELCTCNAQSFVHTTAFLQWNSSQFITMNQGSSGGMSLGLYLDNLTRADSGNTFTCWLVTPTYSTRIHLGTYTPLFAYGPDNVTLTSTKTFIPDDGSNITLTCSAKVSPAPRFEWQGHPPEAVILPGCCCGNGIYSETLTFDPQVYRDGATIKCIVKNAEPDYWPVSQSAQFVLRFQPHKPQTVSIQQHVTLVVTLAAMLATSLFLLFLQWRKQRAHVCETNAEQTERKHATSRRRQREREREPLLDSIPSYQSSCSSEEFLHPENPSVQSYGD